MVTFTLCVLKNGRQGEMKELDLVRPFVQFSSFPVRQAFNSPPPPTIHSIIATKLNMTQN